MRAVHVILKLASLFAVLFSSFQSSPVIPDDTIRLASWTGLAASNQQARSDMTSMYFVEHGLPVPVAVSTQQSGLDLSAARWVHVTETYRLGGAQKCIVLFL